MIGLGAVMGFAEQLQNEVDRLRNRRQELVSEIEAVDTELKECEIALRVAKKLGVTSADITFRTHPPQVSITKDGATQDVPKFKGRINKLALHILKRAYPRGMTASDIRQAAADHHETEIKSTTLTVALGRFKERGVVRIDGRTWHYVPEQDRLVKQPEQPTEFGVSVIDTGPPVLAGGPVSDDEAPSSNG